MPTFPTPRAWLNRKNLSFATLLACTLYAFARGFYPPNIWSTNYYLVNYFDGFRRRALIGSLLYPFGDLRLNYWFIASIQMAVSAALLFFVLVKLRTLQKQEGYIYVYAAVCLFCLSTYGAFFFGNVGYSEHAMYLLVLLSFSVRNSALRVAMATSTILIHDIAVFTCLPLWFAIEYIYFGRRKTAFVTAALGFALLLFTYAFFQTASTEAIAEYRQFISAAPYNARFDYMYVFEEGFVGEGFNWRTNYDGGFKHWADGAYILFCIATSFILATGARFLKNKEITGKFVTAVIFLSSTAALVLGFVAIDINRWAFLALANTFVLYVLFQNDMKIWVRYAFIGTSGAGFWLSNIYLFDERPYRTAAEALQFILHIGSHMKAALI